MGVLVGRGTTVGIGIGVAVGEGAGGGAEVGAMVGVAVGTSVAVGVGVGTGVLVGVGVGVGVAEGTGVLVGAAVGAGVGVAVGTGVCLPGGAGVGGCVGTAVAAGVRPSVSAGAETGVAAGLTVAVCGTVATVGGAVGSVAQAAKAKRVARQHSTSVAAVPRRRKSLMPCRTRPSTLLTPNLAAELSIPAPELSTKRAQESSQRVLVMRHFRFRFPFVVRHSTVIPAFAGIQRGRPDASYPVARVVWILAFAGRTDLPGNANIR